MKFSSNPKFWNDPAIVTEFRDLKPPPYWTVFFSRLRKQGQRKVLDLGCGGGRNTQLLAELGFNFWACDLSEMMLKVTRQRLSTFLSHREIKRRVVKASILVLPFRSRFFNTVLSNGVYHNVRSVDELAATIAETARVLKEGGLLAVNLFYRGGLHGDLRLDKRGTDLFYNKQGVSMVLLQKNKLLVMFRQQGFVPIGGLKTYETDISTGKRSVLRGVFKKAR